ncbi:GNAT family N-acetyltransferase [Streptomyces sp. NPDC047072]|uniref:GNAT family N-acetyltransferase n=1 Tax=Streptomyces sp. NPDC047072 TaxID=3154809 RepID=UPI0033ECD40D
MDDDRLLIREMTLADCDRVAEIRVRGWQNAYRGLMPQPFLDAMSVTEDAEHRRSRFSTAHPEIRNLVAEWDGEVVGWACDGPYRDGEARTAEAELYALYVDARRQGAGIGHALLLESLGYRTALDHGRMCLWVLKGNAHARRFYERHGFEADGVEEPFEVDGVAVPEVRYVRELPH